jgi:hypothetical protein
MSSPSRLHLINFLQECDERCIHSLAEHDATVGYSGCECIFSCGHRSDVNACDIEISLLTITRNIVVELLAFLLYSGSSGFRSQLGGHLSWFYSVLPCKCQCNAVK